MVAYFIQTLQEIVLLFSWIKYFFYINDINDIYIYIYNIYMAHHFILLRRNPFGLRVDRDG